MITASVVLYNTGADQLDAVVRSFAPSAERRLYLIDNSPRRSAHAAAYAGEDVEYIFNDANLGYGAGHNIGLRRSIAAGARYHVVLNPDVRFDPAVIDELAGYADRHPDVLYLLPKVLSPDGELQHLCKLLPTPADLIFRRFLPQTPAVRRRNARYELRESGYDRIINPPCLSGCFMFLRTAALSEHQLFFDEGYFMYCEDFDFLRRLHRYGKTLYYPRVTIVHDHARESYHNKRMLRIHMRSAIRYFNKFGWLIDRERDQQNARILREIRRGRTR